MLACALHSDRKATGLLRLAVARAPNAPTAFGYHFRLCPDCTETAISLVGSHLPDALRAVLTEAYPSDPEPTPEGGE